jgi:hypothetical protein
MGAQPAAQLMALTLCLPHAVAAAAHSGGLLSPYDGVVVSAIVDTGADGETVVHLVPREQLLSSLDTDGWAPREAAWGVFNDSSYYHVGWGKLEIHTNPKLADAVMHGGGQSAFFQLFFYIVSNKKRPIAFYQPSTCAMSY